MPKISVCIASYNHANYISKTIESVLQQSMSDFELLISDDCSKDNSVAIIKSFNDKRIRLFENNFNSGYSVNVNKCIESASGEYIALMGSDDLMHKNRLQKQVEFLEQNQQYCGVFTHAQTIDVNNQEIDNGIMGMNNHKQCSHYKKISKLFYGNNFLWAPTALIKKAVFNQDQVGLFNPALLQTQDFEMWIRILLAGFDFGLIEEKLTKYRISNHNLSYANKKVDSGFLSRIYFENLKVLNSFLLIKSVDDFVQSFPEISKEYNEIKLEYIPFYLAIAAAKFAKNSDFKNSVIYQQFATNILYDIWQDDEKRNYIQQNYQFYFADLMKLVSDNKLIGELCKSGNNLSKFNKRSFWQKVKRSINKKVCNDKK